MTNKILSSLYKQVMNTVSSVIMYTKYLVIPYRTNKRQLIETFC